MLDEKHIRVAFDILDKNGDGFLSIDELKWRFTYINTESLMDELNVADDFWIEVMQEFDQNEDG